MAFFDDVKEKLGFDSDEEKAAKKAEEAAKEVEEARKDLDTEADEADRARAEADLAAAREVELPKPGTSDLEPTPSVVPPPESSSTVSPPLRTEEKHDRPKADRHDAPAKAGAHEQVAARTYTVKSGDTLSEIGQRFGVDWHDIARVNDIENPDLIFPGQVFKIPAK